MAIRRLAPGDEALLQLLAADDADFDVSDRGDERPPLGDSDARAYLADPGVLHWVWESAGVVEGFLQCQTIRKHAGNARELLLYEIGVRSAVRRRGIGRALIQTMYAWMAEQGIAEVWLLADNPEAVEFYRACGFTAPSEMASYMTAER